MLDGILVEATLICTLNIKFKLYPMRKVLLLLKTFKPKKEKKASSGCSVKKRQVEANLVVGTIGSCCRVFTVKSIIELCLTD